MSQAIRSMDELCDMRCQHIGPEGAWAQTDIEAQLSHLVGWAATYSAKGQALGLLKRYAFSNFEGVKLAISALNHIADEQDHHPTASYSYGYLEVNWNTHSAEGISDNDWICAAKLDKALKYLG